MKRLFRSLLALGFVCAALILLIPILIRFSVTPYIFTRADEVPPAQAVLVLGASVARGAPSPTLARRADAAIELYTAGKVKKILVTGDNGELTHDEVTPVRKYLIEKGIAPDDIFLDHAGFDTYSSMYRAKEVFGAQSLIIVTQDFHLPRALFIARGLGIESYGYIAEGGTRLSSSYAREIPASAKAVLDLLSRRTPEYLGEKIPLSGSGMVTWY